jgi:hypothetical protein
LQEGYARFVGKESMVSEAKKNENEQRNKNICTYFDEIIDNDEFEISAWVACDEVRKRLLSESIELTQRYIYQIVIEHYKINKEREKLRRFWKLRKIEKEKKTSHKDILDIIEQERKELEGDKALVDQSHNITVNFGKYDPERLLASRRTVGSI